MTAENYYATCEKFDRERMCTARTVTGLTRASISSTCVIAVAVVIASVAFH